MKMNLLGSLLNTLKRHGITLSKVRQNNSEANLEREAYLLDEVVEYIWRTENTDEDLLAAHFYGDDADRNTNAYKKMKQRLVDRLTGEIINLGAHAPVLSTLQKGFYSAHREYVIATILDGRGVKTAGAYFYRRALSKAVKYDAVKIEMMSLYALRSHAAAVEKDHRKFQEYSVRYKATLQKVVATNEVAEYYHSLTIIYDASPKVLADIHVRALSFLKILDDKYSLDEFGYLYAFVYFQLKMLSRYSASLYPETITVADEAIAYFSTLPYSYSAQLAVFLLHKVVFYTILKQYTLGMEAYHQCAKHMGSDSSNWSRLQEAAFRLLVYRKWYGEAYDTYINVVSTYKFSSMPERRMNRWQINRAYLYYLKDAGTVEFDTISDPLGSFRLGKFLNSLPKLDKQKEGNNIPILIIRVLFLIQRGDHLEAIERIDSMEKYLTRYLRRGENYRSKCFIKILQQFARGDFQVKEGQRRTFSWYSKLLASPINQSNQSYEIEIVPYEDMYSVMMGLPLGN